MCLSSEAPKRPLVHSGLESGDLITLVPCDLPALNSAQLWLVPTTLLREPGSAIDYARELRSVTSLLLTLPCGLAPNLPLASLAEVNLPLPTANTAVSLAVTQRICFTLVLLCNRISTTLSLCSVTLWSRKIFLWLQTLFLETKIRHCIGCFLCVTARSLGLPDLHSSHCDGFSQLQLLHADAACKHLVSDAGCIVSCLLSWGCPVDPMA